MMVVAVLTAAATSAATFFALRSLTGDGVREVQVPEVGGLRLDEARSLLQGRKLALAISDTRESARVEAGKIMRQTPPAGSLVRPSSEVRVVVSAGEPLVAVPSVLRLSLSTATELLAGAGLRPGKVDRREDATLPADQVLASQPAPGQRLPRGGAVDLSVSAGPAPAAVPSVLGRTQAQAAAILDAAGFKVGRVTFGYDEDRRGGVVIKQTPAAQAEVPPGSAVNLVLNESE